jgi:hypothetical protein
MRVGVVLFNFLVYPKVNYTCHYSGLGDRVRVPVGSTIFNSISSKPALGPTQPPIQWVSGAFSSVVKRPGHEADYSPPASVEVKEIWIYTTTPSHVFMA